MLCVPISIRAHLWGTEGATSPVILLIILRYLWCCHSYPVTFRYFPSQGDKDPHTYMPYHHHGCRASVAWERGQGEGEKTRWRREDKVLLPVFLSSVHFLTPSRSLKYRGSSAQGPRFLVHTCKVLLFVTQNSVTWQHAAKDPLTLPHECVTLIDEERCGAEDLSHLKSQSIWQCCPDQHWTPGCGH